MTHFNYTILTRHQINYTVDSGPVMESMGMISLTVSGTFQRGTTDIKLHNLSIHVFVFSYILSYNCDTGGMSASLPLRRPRLPVMQ